MAFLAEGAGALNLTFLTGLSNSSVILRLLSLLFFGGPFTISGSRLLELSFTTLESEIGRSAVEVSLDIGFLTLVNCLPDTNLSAESVDKDEFLDTSLSTFVSEPFPLAPHTTAFPNFESLFDLVDFAVTLFLKAGSLVSWTSFFCLLALLLTGSAESLTAGSSIFALVFPRAIFLKDHRGDSDGDQHKIRSGLENQTVSIILLAGAALPA